MLYRPLKLVVPEQYISPRRHPPQAYWPRRCKGHFCLPIRIIIDCRARVVSWRRIMTVEAGRTVKSDAARRDTGRNHRVGISAHTRMVLEIVDILRVVFVAIAAAAVWSHLWEPFHRVNVIGLAATLIGGYGIFKRSIREHHRAAHDSGTVHDHRFCLRSCHRRIFYRTGHYRLCFGSRNS
jgi:hypothetical protein